MTRAIGHRFLPSLLLALLAGTALHRPLAAQGADGSIRGTVIRSDDRSPVRGLTVAVQGTGLSTVTDNQGRYVLLRVRAGEATLAFRLFGFAPQERTVTVPTGGSATLDVELEMRPVTLGEIVVEAASRTPERIVEAPAAIAVVAPTFARDVAATGQVPMALQSVPGVDIVQSGVNDFNVNARGFNSSLNRRVLVLQDGRDLAIAFLGVQEWNATSIPLDEMGRIEMVRGPGSALYGANAFAGVLNITTPSPRDIRGTRVSFGGGELDTWRGDLRHAGVVAGGRLGYRFNVGYQQSDTWSRSRTARDSSDLALEYVNATDSLVGRSREVTPLNGQTLGVFNLATGERDPVSNTYGSGRLDWYARSGMVSTLEAGTAHVENEVFVTGIGRVQVLEADRPWARVNVGSSRFNLMGWYAGRNTHQPMRSLGAGIPLSEESRIYHVEGQVNQNFSGDRARVVLGASYRRYSVNTGGTLMAPADDDRSDNYVSAFGQLELRLTGFLRAVVAARVDDGSLFASQFSPKAALVYSPNRDHSIRLTVNRAFQTPNFGEFFLRVPAGAPTASPRALENSLNGYFAAAAGAPLPGSVTAGLNLSALPWAFDSLTTVQALGNRNLTVETVTGWELGYKGSVGNRFFLTVDLYRNDLRNFVTDLLPGVNPDYPSFTLTEQGRDVLATLDSLDRRMAAIGLPATHPLRAPIPLLRGGYTALNRQAGPLLATLPSGSRALVVSYTNAGRVVEQGVEIGGTLAATDHLRFEASYSWFDFSVKSQQLGDKLLPNTPKWKGTLGLAFDDGTLDGSAMIRFQPGLPWSAGVFSGWVPSSQQVTLAAGYRVTRRVRVHGIVTNLTDQRRFAIYGGSVNGRRALVGVTADF